MSKTTIPTAPAAPGSASIALKTPLQRGEQTITEITLREPRAGELRGIALYDLLRLDVAELTTLLPRITTPTLTAADVGNLTLPDLMDIAGKVAGFFAPQAEAPSPSQEA
ncbi:MAG: phage tail assembly protein [Pseudomonadota bacterium]|nr:phage tail assembly protein [Pseudomonadota bacterium]